MATTTTSLRERAIEAHDAQMQAATESREEREAEERARMAAALRNLLREVLSIEAEPTENECVVDGIRFHCGRSEHDNYTRLFISEKCQSCDSNLVSYPIRFLSDLGAALKGGYWKHHEHWYADDSKWPQPIAPVVAPPTTEELVISALRTLIEESVR